jgi:predicted RND superfamily exporter protein
MKSLIISILLTFSFSAFTQSKADVSKMLEQMKAQGMFSEQDLKKAQAELDKMNSKDFSGIVNKANTASKDPEVLKKVKELEKSL